jgi:hypothetical protein
MPRGPFTWRPFWHKWATTLDTAITTSRSGSLAPPSWFYAVKRSPPRTLYHASEPPPLLVFPEERLEGVCVCVCVYL